MPENPNFFLGYGERLTTRIPPPGGGGSTEPAYSFEEAVARLQPMIQETFNGLESLPDMACPDNQAIGVVTLHPQWIAKSYHPYHLLNQYDLRQVGSRPVEIRPEKWTRRSETTEVASTELFLAGSRESFQRWASDLAENPRIVNTEIRRLEQVRAPITNDRIRNFSIEDFISGERVLLEVVLHASEDRADDFILSGFAQYAETLGALPDLERRLHAGGLCFMPVEVDFDVVGELTQFSFLRVARPMPRMRELPSIQRSASRPELPMAELPTENALDPDFRIAVFDGGLDASSPLIPWAVPFLGQGVSDEVPNFMLHGHWVTSAVLFGSLEPGQPAPRPYAVVDHYRVLDAHPQSEIYELYEVLRRIEAVLRTGRYQFINLSIGPAIAVEEDEVHTWTAILDKHLSDGTTLATIAVGNTGKKNRTPGDRIQPPSDCVNGFSIGSANSKQANWKRATYSSWGPGRSPGVVKPDVVQFGGELPTEPFFVYDDLTEVTLVGIHGTSFAAPSVLRLATGVRAHFGSRINPLALKALIVHAADSAGHHRHEVGWGRVPSQIEDIAVCPDGTVRIVYQGELNPSQYLQARIPMPNARLLGKVTIKATFCYATQTDPQDPGSYTRSGLEVTFRPHSQKFFEDSTVAKTASFFKKGDFETEQALRGDAQKWETTLNAHRTFLSKSLYDPVLDIHYNARTGGGAARDAERIRYALVITVEAKRVPDLYDQVVRTFSGILEPLLPIVEIPIRV